MRRISSVNLVSFLKSNGLFVFHYIVYLISFLFGSLSVVFSFSFTDSSEFNSLISSYFNLDFWGCFVNQFLLNLLILTILYFLSFYPFGAPLSVFVFSFYSLGVGCLLTAVCKHIGAKGLMISLIRFVLPFIANLFIYSLLSSAAISYSHLLLQAIFGKKSIPDFNRKTKDTFLLYIILIFAAFIVALVASLLNMIVYEL